MLILSRNKGQRIIIGDNIAVTVLGVYNGEVQLGITAPKDVPVDREEIRLRKDAERAAE